MASSEQLSRFAPPSPIKQIDAAMGANDKMFGTKDFWPLDSQKARDIPVVGRVFKISLPDAAVTIAIDANPLMPCPNGVGFGKDGQILVGAFFRGNLLELRDGQLQVVADGLRGADAGSQDSKGNYHVSSWNQSKVWRVNASTKEIALLVQALPSAADFLLEESANRILFPDTKSGTLQRIDLP